MNLVFQMILEIFCMISNTTKDWIDLFVKRPKAALIIESNDDRISSDEVVKTLYKRLVKGIPNRLFSYNFKEANSIGIQDVKKLLESLHLKADSNQHISRFIVLHDAEKLTKEAQNALLKTIEELPDHTVLILISSRAHFLLPTIQSRCFLLPIKPITKKEALDYARTHNFDAKKAETAFALSSGKFGMYMEFLDNDDLPIYDKINIVKQFINDTPFQRQKTLQAIKDGQEIQEFLAILKLTSLTGMRVSKSLKDKQKWKHILQNTIKTQDEIDKNVNVKLCLLNLSVAI